MLAALAMTATWDPEASWPGPQPCAGRPLFHVAGSASVADLKGEASSD